MNCDYKESCFNGEYCAGSSTDKRPPRCWRFKGDEVEHYRKLLANANRTISEQNKKIKELIEERDANLHGNSGG